MSTLFLVRHGKPAFPHGRRLCIGSYDLPLGPQGRQQAKLLRDYFLNKNISAVYASPLQRSLETASILSSGRRVCLCPDLREVHMGEWEGLSFPTIQKQYPDLYAKRAQNQFLQPPGGEKMADALCRFKSTIEDLLKENTGDIVVVAHRSVNLLYLASLAGVIGAQTFDVSQPYGCLSRLSYFKNSLRIEQVGFTPAPYPDDTACAYLLQKYKTPHPVVLHGMAVAGKASEIAKNLNACGLRLNIGLVQSAAVLHDIARKEQNHAHIGAKWLEKEQYPEVAAIVRQHHNLETSNLSGISEAAVVFLADKLVQETTCVSLEKRFSDSMKKCAGQAALQKHNQCYRQAKNVEKMMQALMEQARWEDQHDPLYQHHTG